MNALSERACLHDPFDVAVTRTERRTWWAVGLTLAMMVAELVVGAWSRSLALTADGWHMATHAGALALSGAAWWYARTRAKTLRYSFGTGKVHALAGFTNALALLAVAAEMLYEAALRLMHPARIRYDEALAVAAVGLVVNLGSAWLLTPADGHDHGHGAHDHGHDHDHDHGAHDHDHGAHNHGAHDHGHGHGHGAHNARAAYLHVLADALTSVFAIVALVLGRRFGWGFLDPLTAVLGSVMIVRWGVGLIRGTMRPLLDEVPSEDAWRQIRQDLEATGATVVDLHLWEPSEGRWSCIVTLAADAPLPIDRYRDLVRARGPVGHLTIELAPRL